MAQRRFRWSVRGARSACRDNVTRLTKPVRTAPRLIAAGPGAHQNPSLASWNPSSLPRSTADARALKAAIFGAAAFALLALASYGFTVYDLAAALSQDGLAYTLVDRDFANYWLAGKLVLSGEYLDLFHHDAYFPHLQQLFGTDYQIRSWSYPPHYLLLVWPLGFLTYGTGLVVFLSCSLLLFVGAVVLFRRELAPQSSLVVLVLALSGFVVMMLAATQNGFLTGAALLCGLACMNQRPMLAGLAFACLTVKPQLGLLIPVLLLFDRNWIVFVWSAVFTAALVLVSAALFGLDSWAVYLTDTLAYQRSVMTDWDGIFLRMMPTVFGSMRSLGFSPALAAMVQWPVSLAALAAVSWLLYRESDPLRRIFVITCGTFLITPYAFNYDMGALSVCAALLAGSTSRGKSLAVPMAIVASIPAALTNLGRAGLPCAPLVFAFGLAVIGIAAGRFSARRAHEMPASAPTGS